MESTCRLSEIRREIYQETVQQTEKGEGVSKRSGGRATTYHSIVHNCQPQTRFQKQYIFQA